VAPIFVDPSRAAASPSAARQCNVVFGDRAAIRLADVAHSGASRTACSKRPEQLELNDVSLLAPPTRVYRHKTRYDASTRSFDPALFSVVKRMLLADAGFA
jgi:hypothetical protein